MPNLFPRILASALLASSVLVSASHAQVAATPAAPSAVRAAQGTRSGASAGSRLADRFQKANVTHDGHLTKDEAVAARWPTVTRNFDSMDIGHNGYITIDDIQTWRKAH